MKFHINDANAYTRKQFSHATMRADISDVGTQIWPSHGAQYHILIARVTSKVRLIMMHTSAHHHFCKDAAGSSIAVIVPVGIEVLCLYNSTLDIHHW